MGIFRLWPSLMLALSGVLAAVALPVAADTGSSPLDNAGRVSDDQKVDSRCQVVTYRVLADADVMMGTVVGGPYSGFPVTVVTVPGTGNFALNTIVQVPSTYTPFVPTMANGTPAGGWNDAAPGSFGAIFFARQSLHANDLFTADRGGTILTSRPDALVLSGCE